VRTEDLIVELVRSAEPVQPLPSPWVRMAQWTGGAALIAVLGVVVIHPRQDLSTVILQPAFVGLAAATAITALFAAVGAFALSVPGAGRPLHRVVPIVAGGVWALMLIDSLRVGGHSLQRTIALPVHLACIAEIVGLGLVPGWVIFKMLRRAAPLQRAWTGALATLAAVGLSATATQIICPINDPAHQLVGHFAPVAALVVVGAVVGRRSLEWLRGA
jgi:hypothetical protein